MYLHQGNSKYHLKEESYSDFLGIGEIIGLAGSLVTEQNGACPLINGGDCRKRKQQELALQEKQLELTQQYLATRGGETNWTTIGLISIVAVAFIGVVVWLYKSKK